jgi:hypothetical protein
MDISLAHRPVPQGRRPSVERTTTRRCPSARRRPGAGYLPAWLPVVGVSSQERFRVVAEDEFFEGVGLGWTGAAARTSHRGRRRRTASVAMLLGAVGATAGVSAASLSSRAAHSPRPGTFPALPPAQQSAGAPRARDLAASVASRVARRRDGLGTKRRSRGRRATAVHATDAVRATGPARHPRQRPMRSSARAVVDAVRPVAAEPVVARRGHETTTTTAGGGTSRSHTRESEFGFER